MIFENDNITREIGIPIENVGNDIQVDGIKLITEGKSGLMKALKTIKDDLRCEENNLFMKVEGDKFKVTAKIDFTQLLV